MKNELLLRIGSKLNEDFINATDKLQMPKNGNEKHVYALGDAMEDIDYLLWG